MDVIFPVSCDKDIKN